MCGGGGLAGLIAPALGLAFGGPVGAAMGLEGAAAPIVGGALVGGLGSVATGGKFLPGVISGGLGGYGGYTPVPDAVAAAASASGGDAIQMMSQLSEGMGGAGWTDVAQSYGFGSPEALISSALPGAATVSANMMSGPANLLYKMGLPNAASSVGGLNISPANIASNVTQSLLPRNGPGASASQGPLSTALGVGSGLYGMYEAQQLKKQMAQLGASADPFGPYRAQYAQQLSALQSDPSRITSMPGYQAGLEAVQRSMAAQGYTGSGNMMAALSKYGGDFYNQQVQQLAGLAGAGISPATGASITAQGLTGAADLTSRGLASIGYGTRMAGF